MALSAQTYQGDGSNTDFVLDFTLGYISESHIHVYVDDVEIPQNVLQFILGGGSVRLPTAPTSGSEVLVRRIVPNDKLLHDYENGSLVIESNLDESNLQSIMLQHEAVDGFSTGIYGDINFFTEISDSTEDTAESPRGVEQVTITGLASLAEEQRDEFETSFNKQNAQFEETFNAQFTYKRVGNISDYVGQALPEADKLNSYQYPDDSGNWYAPIQGQPFPYMLPSDPTVANSGMVLTSTVGIYQGLWPDTGGSAYKGDTYQTQVSGTPTGQYFTALQNTTVDPVGDGVNWREVVTQDLLYENSIVSHKSLADALIDTHLVEGSTINIKEREAGLGGGGVWDAVLASSVTPNTFNIVQCVGSPLIALMLRVNNKMEVSQFRPIGQLDVAPVLSAMRDAGVNVAQINNEYTLLTQFAYGDNFYLNCGPSGKLIVDDSMLIAGVVSHSKNNIGWGTLRMEGPGRAFVDGNERLIQLNSSSNIYGETIILNNSTNFGLTLDDCSIISIDKVIGDSNYSSLLQIRNGTKNGKINYVYGDNCGYSPNADISPTGRCVTTWELSDFDFGTVITKRASEYGFRLYSEAADTLPTKNITIGRVISKNCRREQGGSGVGFFIYNESGLISDITVGQVHVDIPVQAGRTHVGVSLQGEDVTVNQVALTTEVAGNNVGIAYNSGDRISVMGGTAKNVGTLISYGATLPAVNTETKGLLCSEISEIAGDINGDGHRLKSITASFASGHTFPAISLSDVYYTEVDDCEFDGAYRCISLTNSPSRITDNRSKNTVDVPIRKFGTSVTGLQMYGNSWDKLSNPREIGNIDLIMPAGEGTPQCVVRTPISPSAFVLDLPIRSIAYSTDQGLLPNHIGWVKTATGTWSTFGEIS